MSNHLSVGQIIVDAQRMASRVKDLDALGTALLEDAESNNRMVESMRQYHDDIESLNRISNNKTNADMVNRIQQQNVNSSEILKENRELKIVIEDCERAMELIMHKYREHTVSKVLESKINFKELYNERLYQIIREQREKINEMAAVMQRAASIDDDTVNREMQLISRLRLENNTLRELLQISKQYGSAQCPIRENEHLLEEKSVQTDTTSGDDSAEDLSISGASIENVNNNTVIQVYCSNNRTTEPTVAAAATAAAETTTTTATTEQSYSHSNSSSSNTSNANANNTTTTANSLIMGTGATTATSAAAATDSSATTTITRNNAVASTNANDNNNGPEEPTENGNNGNGNRLSLLETQVTNSTDVVVNAASEKMNNVISEILPTESLVNEAEQQNDVNTT